MDPKQLQDLCRMGKEFRIHEKQPEGNPRGGKLRAQPFRPVLQAGLIEISSPMGRDRILISHGRKLSATILIATPTQRREASLWQPQTCGAGCERGDFPTRSARGARRLRRLTRDNSRMGIFQVRWLPAAFFGSFELMVVE